MKTRKRILYLTILLLAAGAALLFSRHPQPNIVSWYVCDIDGDSREELLLITAASADLRLDTGEEYGDTLAVYDSYKIRKNRPVVQGEPEAVFDLASIKPLKVRCV